MLTVGLCSLKHRKQFLPKTQINHHPGGRSRSFPRRTVSTSSCHVFHSRRHALRSWWALHIERMFGLSPMLLCRRLGHHHNRRRCFRILGFWGFSTKNSSSDTEYITTHFMETPIMAPAFLHLFIGRADQIVQRGAQQVGGIPMRVWAEPSSHGDLSALRSYSNNLSKVSTQPTLSWCFPVCAWRLKSFMDGRWIRWNSVWFN